MFRDMHWTLIPAVRAGARPRDRPWSSAGAWSRQSGRVTARVILRYHPSDHDPGTPRGPTPSGAVQQTQHLSTPGNLGTPASPPRAPSATGIQAARLPRHPPGPEFAEFRQTPP